MSLPHTGRLVAEIDGQRCTFDGDQWSTPSAELTELLNATTATTPKHHYLIEEVARNVIWLAGLEGRARIIEWTHANWPDELPPGAVD